MGFRRKWRRAALALAAGGAFALLALFYLVPWFLPLPPGLEEGRHPVGLLLSDREDRPLRRLLDGELRADEPAGFEEFPERLVEATLAAEDSRFFSHGGVDPIAVARALRDSIRRGRLVSGASTITQQTVKLHSPARRRDLRAKLAEAFAARRLEISSDKRTILAAYLNRLPYGNQFTGARAAARGYFGKPLGDLSLAECALLAGLPNRPSTLDPWRNPEGARRRQRWVLGRMAEEGYVGGAELAAALREEPRLLPGHRGAFHAPHFTELLLARESRAIEEARAQGAARLRTTLDLPLQHFVEQAVAAELARLAQEAGEADDIQAAVVVVENRSGEVLALSGSRAFFGSAAGQINGTWRPRSAGSTLKPFTYALALGEGATAATVLPDTPVEYITPTGAYQPVNFDRRFRGPVSMRHALANSLNVPAVRLLEQIGGAARLHACLVEDLRFTGLAPDPAEYGLGLTLGNAEVRLLELANGYAALARLGLWRPLRFLRPQDDESDRPDRVDPSKEEGFVRVFDEGAAWLVADILSDQRARIAAYGPGSPLDLPFRAAAKTGTSTDFRDSWTLGYTPDYTVGVWVGRFDNRPLRQISGAMGAAPIFHQVMRRLHRDREPRWYDPLPDAARLSVDRHSGKRPPEGVDLPGTRRREEWFLAGSLPETASPEDYDAEGRTRLPLAYADWWKDPANPLQAEAFLEPPSPEASAPPLLILSPLEGTVAFIDPDLPRGGARFPLRAAGAEAAETEWSSETLSVERDGGESWLVLQPGEHEIVARHPRSGRTATARFAVRAL